MDRPAFRGFVMVYMMVGVGEHGVHIVWQYTNGNGIWQALQDRICQLDGEADIGFWRQAFQPHPRL